MLVYVWCLYKLKLNRGIKQYYSLPKIQNATGFDLYKETIITLFDL